MTNRVSDKHREMLLQFLERLPPLALSKYRCRDYIKANAIWDKIAKHLNEIDGSVSRSGKSWCRYWSDIKFKLRRRYSMMQQTQKEGEIWSQFSALEQRFLKILTDEQGRLINTTISHYEPPRQRPLKNFEYCQESNDNDNSALINNDDEETNEPAINEEEHLMSTEEIIALEENLQENVNNSGSYGDSSVEHNDHEYNNEPVIDEIHDVNMPTEEIILQENLHEKIKSEKHKDIEDIKREFFEFQLQKQKELFKIEKEHRQEKHQLEIDILNLRKEIMKRQLYLLQKTLN